MDELGPYNVAFTRSGRFAALAGRKGHLALFEWAKPRLYCEVQVRETCRDVTFLHNEQFFAVAQKKYNYIYDKRGLEVHCLRETTEPYRCDPTREPPARSHSSSASVGVGRNTAATSPSSPTVCSSAVSGEGEGRRSPTCVPGAAGWTSFLITSS